MGKITVMQYIHILIYNIVYSSKNRMLSTSRTRDEIFKPLKTTSGTTLVASFNLGWENPK